MAEFGQRFRIVRWSGKERARGDEVPSERLRIMRGDHAARQADVGQVLPIGMGRRVGEIGNAG